jgi:hypothetical protein
MSLFAADTGEKQNSGRGDDQREHQLEPTSRPEQRDFLHRYE